MVVYKPMKFGIISDTHDNLANINIALDYFNKEKIDVIIHAGDLCFVDSVKHILKKFSGQLFLVEGNGDDETEKFLKIEKQFPNFKYSTNFGELQLEDCHVAFVHKPDQLNELAETEKYDLIIYGHTHQPWEKYINTQAHNKKVHLLNPGTLAGLFAKATFAVYDTNTKQAQLIILELLASQYAHKN